jgi:hypothetical protein
MILQPKSQPYIPHGVRGSSALNVCFTFALRALLLSSSPCALTNLFTTCMKPDTSLHLFDPLDFTLPFPPQYSLQTY